MVTVTRAEFLADAAGVLRRSGTEGPIGIQGEDGKVGMIVHAPRDVRESVEDELYRLWERVSDEAMTPIAMVLTCPMCRQQHIDEGERETRIHRTHQCVAGYTWRDV